jgi:hypothetical protein
MMYRYSKITHKFITIILLLLVIAGCGGGGGGSDKGPSEVVSEDPDNNNDEVTDDPTGGYDLAAYMFDASLRQVGGFVSYRSHMHSIPTGNELMAELEVSGQWEATADNTIVYSVNNTGEPSDTYVIHDTSIEKTVHGSDDEVISMNRFVSIGETYQDEHIEDPFDYEIMPPGEEFPDRHITCQVMNHLDSFDIDTVSSQLSYEAYDVYNLEPFTMDMADGVYHDVLHMRCLMTLNEVTINDIDTFYARGIGGVLSVEKIGILTGGPSVYILERSGTVYYGSSQ